MKWRHKHLIFIAANRHLTDKRLGEILGWKAGYVKRLRHRFKIFKPLTRFKRGHRVWNKGISFQQQPGSIAARFKPGHKFSKGSKKHESWQESNIF